MLLCQNKIYCLKHCICLCHTHAHLLSQGKNLSGHISPQLIGVLIKGIVIISQRIYVYPVPLCIGKLHIKAHPVTPEMIPSNSSPI